MPRKSNDEMITELEQKLAKAKENAVTRVQTQIEKLEEKKNLLLERGKKIDGQVKDVDLEISKLKADDSATFSGQASKSSDVPSTDSPAGHEV